MKINERNYREMLLDYLDHELSGAKAAAFEQFMEEHADVKEEFLLLQKTRFSVSEERSFPNKEALYQPKNKNTKWYWWSRAAVAAILFGLLILGWNEYGEGSRHQGEEALLLQKELPQPSVPTRQKAIKKETATTHSGAMAQTTTAQSGLTQPSTEEKQSSTSPAALQKESTAQNKKTLPAHPSQKAKSIQPIRATAAYVTVPVKNSFTPKMARYSVESDKKNVGNINNLLKTSKTTSSVNKWAIKIPQNEDTTLSDKIYALQNKITHPMKTLNIKRIKIGHLSVQFN